MKPLLAAVAGFVVAMGLFAGGIAVATGVIMVEEAPPARAVGDLAEVWTGKPRPVDVEAQDFERVGPAVIASADDSKTPLAEERVAEGTQVSSVNPGVDTMTTAALLPQVDEQAVQLQAAHVEWCSSHYRSYDPESDSYRPFSGGARACESPYSQELAAMDDPAMAGQRVAASVKMADATLQNAGYGADAAGDGVVPSVQHVHDCFSRYRSYRVEDNSYQPYGGGPRLQCE